MPIYLDHTATGRPESRSISEYCRLLNDCYANPASVHALGDEALAILNDARKILAANLGCLPDELIFTSGGTESINLALKGVLLNRGEQRRRLVISAGEHAATWETARWLEKQGTAIEVVPLTAEGTIDLEKLASALARPATLISIIHVSNETGAVNPLSQIVALRDKLQPRTAIHLDAVQTWGKLPLNFGQSGIDLASGSGHKLGSPKGIGWLIKKKNISCDPLIHGGGQQAGLRSGTENPPLVFALARAVELSLSDLAARNLVVRDLRQTFLNRLNDLEVGYNLFSPDGAVPHILSLAFAGLYGETLVNALSARSVYISTGAACGARRHKGNRVLKAMGVAATLSQDAVRISFNDSNSLSEIKAAADHIAGLYRELATRLG